MFNLIIISIELLIAAVLFGLGIYLEPTIGGVFTGFGVFVLIFALIHFIIAWCTSLNRHHSINEQFEVLVEILNNQQHLIKYKNELMEDLKSYLGDKFPLHEKEIFEKISSDDAITLNFPEVKTFKAFKSLVDQLTNLRGKELSMKSSIEHTTRYIRTYYNSKWEFIKIKVPEDLKDIIYKREF